MEAQTQRCGWRAADCSHADNGRDDVDRESSKDGRSGHRRSSPQPSPSIAGRDLDAVTTVTQRCSGMSLATGAPSAVPEAVEGKTGAMQTERWRHGVSYKAGHGQRVKLGSTSLPSLRVLEKSNCSSTGRHSGLTLKTPNVLRFEREQRLGAGPKSIIARRNRAISSKLAEQAAELEELSIVG